MKKLLFSIVLLFVYNTTTAQSLSLSNLWRIVDLNQYVIMEEEADKAFAVNDKLTSVKQSVDLLGLPFGQSYEKTISELEKKEYKREYALEDDIAYKMNGYALGEKCSLFVSGLNDVVYQYYILFDKAYEDFSVLKSDFEKIEGVLNGYFGEPSLRKRDAQNRYLPISSIRSDKGIQFGNIYQTEDGMIFLAAVRHYNFSDETADVKIMIYVIKDDFNQTPSMVFEGVKFSGNRTDFTQQVENKLRWSVAHNTETSDLFFGKYLNLDCVAMVVYTTSELAPALLNVSIKCPESDTNLVFDQIIERLSGQYGTPTSVKGNAYARVWQLTNSKGNVYGLVILEKSNVGFDLSVGDVVNKTMLNSEK